MINVSPGGVFFFHTNTARTAPCIAGKRRWLNLLNARLEQREAKGEGERDVMNGVKFIIIRGSFFFFVVCCLY